MIQQIMKNGCAYVVEGSVYFSIDKFSNYGCLRRMNLEENISGIRVAVHERKHNPKDFVLWKASKPGEPSWDSLWGHGRPGWHIECSAISAHYLTITFDIHAGGRDLIFPHQENEIAQNWAACSESDISYWIHIGTVTRNNPKISKSDGNFISIREKQPNVSMCKFFVAIEKQIKELLCILGLLPTSYSEVLLQLKDKALIRAGLVEDAVKLFIEERAVARGNKDYSRSDKIREKLAKSGIALVDVGNDTIWRPCLPVEDGQQAKQLSSQQ